MGAGASSPSSPAASEHPQQKYAEFVARMREADLAHLRENSDIFLEHLARESCALIGAQSKYDAHSEGSYSNEPIVCRVAAMKTRCGYMEYRTPPSLLLQLFRMRAGTIVVSVAARVCARR
jgi:hypothetical protein